MKLSVISKKGLQLKKWLYTFHRALFFYSYTQKSFVISHLIFNNANTTFLTLHNKLNFKKVLFIHLVTH